MNLLQRSALEFIQKLEDIKYKYPAIYRGIKKELETEYSYLKISFQTVLYCRTYLYIPLDQFSEQFNK